jgi:hypothetical protein
MLTDHFNQFDTQRTGRITLDYEQFLKVAMQFKA